MTQYINKDVLVAEIERQYNYLREHPGTYGAGFILGFRQAGWQISDFIDTLEVKEVDLDKHLKEDIEDVFFDLDGVAVKGATHYLTVEDVKDIAKHFFELGLKAQKGE